MNLKYLPDIDKWELVKPIKVQLFTGNWITIPTGFITDLATVPWWGRWLVNVTGRHNLGSITHDYLYFIGFYKKLGHSSHVARKLSDEAQFHINCDARVDTITAIIIYMSGRIGGSRYWNKYRKNEQS